MSQYEETPISYTTPTNFALHLGLHSLDPDPTPNASPSDLNHSTEETEHDESNLRRPLQNLDLKEEEEVEKKDDEKRESDNNADYYAAGDDEDEEEKNENGNDGENENRNEGRRLHYPVSRMLKIACIIWN